MYVTDFLYFSSIRGISMLSSSYNSVVSKDMLKYRGNGLRMMASTSGGNSGPDNIQNPNGYTEKAWGNYSLTY